MKHNTLAAGLLDAGAGHNLPQERPVEWAKAV